LVSGKVVRYDMELKRIEAKFGIDFKPMKIRNGFVSNSSSSSFVVSLRKLSLEQLCKILNHQIWGERLGIEYAKSDAWDITIRKGVLYSSTSMDNFDMGAFMEKLGVENVVWGDGIQPTAETDDLECDLMCNECQMRFICYTNRGEKR